MFNLLNHHYLVANWGLPIAALSDLKVTAFGVSTYALVVVIPVSEPCGSFALSNERERM